MITGALSVTASALLSALSMENLLPYWWLIPPAIMGQGLYEILQNWAVRTKAFKLVSKTRIGQTVAGSFTKITLGFLGLRPAGLLVGQICLQAVGSPSLIRSFWSEFRYNRRWLTRKNLLFVALRYAEFPKYRLPSQLLLALATKAPLIYFAWQFGAGAAGQLGLALAVLAMPVLLFGRSTGQAYYAEIARIGSKRPEEIYRISKSIVKRLLFASLVPFAVLVLAGPLMFSVAFGEQWEEAGVFASVLSFYLLAQFISVPIANALSVFDRQRLFLLLNMTRVVGVLVMFCFCWLGDLSVVMTLMLYSGFLTLHYLFTCAAILKVIAKII